MVTYKFTETDAKEPKDLNIRVLLSNEHGFGYNNITRTGIYKTHGWAVDFRAELKKYIVKTDYYLEEIYHLNKTDLRKQLTGMGRVHYIKEI